MNKNKWRRARSFACCLISSTPFLSLSLCSLCVTRCWAFQRGGGVVGVCTQCYGASLLGYFLNHLELSTRMYIHRASRIQILRNLSENLSNILDGNPPNKTFRKSPSLNHLTPLTVSAPNGPECYSVGGFFAADFSSTTVLLYRKWVKCLFIFNWICSRSRSTSLCPKLYIHRMHYNFHFDVKVKFKILLTIPFVYLNPHRDFLWNEIPVLVNCKAILVLRISTRNT